MNLVAADPAMLYDLVIYFLRKAGGQATIRGRDLDATRLDSRAHVRAFRDDVFPYDVHLELDPLPDTTTRRGDPMTPLCYIDTETTSLNPDRRAWDVACIRHDDSGVRTVQFFIDLVDIELDNADPFSLKVGRFWERHPQARALTAGRRSRAETRVSSRGSRTTHTSWAPCPASTPRASTSS